MALQIVGAGVGRTGTTSLKAAFEELLGGPTYHMMEVFQHAEHVAFWTAAACGEEVDWEAHFEPYVAAVDWPASAFWPEISAVFPDAPVLLTTRTDPETWWRSASNTIFKGLMGITDTTDNPWFEMWEALTAARFTPRWREPEPAMAAYEAHNAAVRAGVSADRLVEWQPGDGWEPLCVLLGVDVPDKEFPRLNTSEDWAGGPPDLTA